MTRRSTPEIEIRWTVLRVLVCNRRWASSPSSRAWSIVRCADGSPASHWTGGFVSWRTRGRRRRRLLSVPRAFGSGRRDAFVFVSERCCVGRPAHGPRDFLSALAELPSMIGIRTIMKRFGEGVGIAHIRESHDAITEPFGRPVRHRRDDLPGRRLRLRASHFAKAS